MIVETRLPRLAREGLELLRDAWNYAQELQCDPWQFAVELSALHLRGVTTNDLRWLLSKGFIEHAAENTMPEDGQRMFAIRGRHLISQRSCFILASAGLTLVDELIPGSQFGDGELSLPLNSARLNVQFTPRWDSDRQELLVGSQVVKRFKAPALNQEMILAAFEEENWPVRIDDPLPPHPGQEPKRRLHDTINSLNRNQLCAMIRFHGDGRGQGIRWVFIGPAA